jgi:para-aminobenzoate synthetase component 1
LRRAKEIEVNDIPDFKIKLLKWAQSYSEVTWLDSNQCSQAYSNFDAVLAVDAFTSLQTGFDQAFAQLHDYHLMTSDWIFGYLSYDLKNNLEDLESSNFDGLRFPELFFFQPKKLFFFKNSTVTIQYLDCVFKEMDNDLFKIKNSATSTFNGIKHNALKIKPRVSQQDYIDLIHKLKSHIQRGDIYEANFCQEFYANGEIDPLLTFERLQDLSLPPFAVFFKNKSNFLLSASPERYLKKEGNLLISQPIKGTAARSSNATEDLNLKNNLLADPKERSENVMIVDLVRNDLSRIAKKGSVLVEELHAIYSFKQVHHLISTIKAELRPEISAVDAICASYPMGSMTGAPKISAMKIIENLECSKRGLYSGSVGYFTPDGNFDFNVVIRSILYNAKTSYVSLSVGSAITAKSVPEKEYEECLIKAKALIEVLEN